MVIHCLPLRSKTTLPPSFVLGGHLTHTHYSPFTWLCVICCNFGKCAECNCAPMPQSPLYFLPDSFILPHLHNTRTLHLTYTPHTNRKDCLYDQFERTFPVKTNHVTFPHSLILSVLYNALSTPVKLIMTTWLKCEHTRRCAGSQEANDSVACCEDKFKSLNPSSNWRNRMMEERSCSNTCKWQTTKEKALSDHVVPMTVITHVRLSRRGSRQPHRRATSDSVHYIEMKSVNGEIV